MDAPFCQSDWGTRIRRPVGGGILGGLRLIRFRRRANNSHRVLSDQRGNELNKVEPELQVNRFSLQLNLGFLPVIAYSAFGRMKT